MIIGPYRLTINGYKKNRYEQLSDIINNYTLFRALAYVVVNVNRGSCIDYTIRATVIRNVGPTCP